MILAQFGLEKVLLQGNLLMFPEADPHCDEGSQPFDGRLGKLRYLGLALMTACSPLSSEIIQLCMEFPVSHSKSAKDPFDFDEHLKESEKKRAPVVYPILRSHILTHITCCLIAVTGHARTENEGWDVNSTVDDCRQLITMGLVARIAQCLLSKLMEANTNINDWKRNMKFVIGRMQSQKTSDGEYDSEWFSSCILILRAFTEEAGSSCLAEPQEYVHLTPCNENLAQATMQAIDLAKLQAIELLRDLSIIQQVLIPNVFVNSHSEAKAVHDASKSMLKSFTALFGMDSLISVMESDLVKEILRSWFTEATERSSTHLETPDIFPGITWPQSPTPYTRDESNQSHSLLEPLLGGCNLDSESSSQPLCRIVGLPKSYTDLYAELVLLCPDCEQIALCLVCGEVSFRQTTSGIHIMLIKLNKTLPSVPCIGIECFGERRMLSSCL